MRPTTAFVLKTKSVDQGSKIFVNVCSTRKGPVPMEPGPGGVRYPLFSPLGWQVIRVTPYVRHPFPSKENRQIPERDDLGDISAPLSPSPHANSFVIGTAVINTHTFRPARRPRGSGDCCSLLLQRFITKQ